MGLEIRKKSASTWVHIKDGVSIILSKGFFRIQDDKFELTENSGVDQFKSKRTPISQVTVYDDSKGGVSYNFSTSIQLVERLKSLDYPFFNTASGSSDANTNIDGGNASSTYTPEQIVNGGGA